MYNSAPSANQAVVRVPRNKNVTIQLKKKQPTVKSLQARVTKLEHQDELKYRDSYVSTAAVSATPVGYNMQNISQGDDFDQRIGEEIVMKYINIKFRLNHQVGAQYDQVRCLLFWDMQCNGVGYTAYTDPGASPHANDAIALLDNNTIGSSIVCPHNYRTADRYKILMDKVYNLNPDSTATTKGIMISKSFKLGGAKIKYSSSSGASASLATRALTFVVFSSSGSNVTGDFAFRTWFVDP